jgi:nicotinamidase-related amidase
MKRCLIAVDIQGFFRPSAGMVAQINQLSQSMPTAATLMKHDEAKVPLVRFGRPVPMDNSLLIGCKNVFDKYGFALPQGVTDWLRIEAPDEVIIAGGHTDGNVLSAGFDVYNAGFKPAIVPLLCYGNDWYMHTVTTKIWEQELGKVYQSIAELKFGGAA